MKPLVVPVNPEHWTVIRDFTESDRRVILDARDSSDGCPCCTRLRKLESVHIPQAGILFMCVNYCPVCGSKLKR